MAAYLEKESIKIGAQISDYVNNMTLVQRMIQYNTQELPALAAIMSPDIDIQLQVQRNLTFLYETHHISIQTQHVRGHQDREKKKMTWQESLNVMADKTASESRDRERPDKIPVPAKIVAI